MNTNAWPLILVVTGGLIGIIGALASTLTTALLAERKLKLELRHKLQELAGNRQALEYLVGKQGQLESFSDTTRQHFLKLSEAERLAFTVGFLTRANDKYEVDAKELAELTRSADKLYAEREALISEKMRLEQQVRESIAHAKSSGAP